MGSPRVMSDFARRLARLTQDVRLMTAGRFAYHGAWKRFLPSIRKYGLAPGAASSYSDSYSEYDDGRHLFFSDDEGYIAQHYGDTVLRFPWPSDAKPDKNTFGRRLPGQFVSRQAVPPGKVEVKAGGRWIPLLEGRQASLLNKTYYHATYLEDAEKIAKSGFRINRARGRGKILGPAVYVTADKSFSEGYAADIVDDEERDAGMLHLRLTVSKFWDVRMARWTDQMWEQWESAGGSRGARNDYPLMGQVALKHGYEAAGTPEGNVAVFDPSRIRVVKVEPMLAR